MAAGVAVLALAAVVVRLLTGGGGELAAAGQRLAHAALPWLGAAIGAEALSYCLYAQAQRRLLARAAPRIGIGWLASLALCAQGVSNFVPVGYLAANLLNFHELCRRGLAASVCAWLLVMSSAMYVGTLACLTVVGGEIAGGRAGGSLLGVRVGATILLVALPLIAFSVRLLGKRGRLRLPAGWQGQLQPPGLSAPAVSGAALLFMGCWLADAGCLVTAMRAVGASPAWSLVPIAYCAAQLVSFLPITPGGLGLVEGSLTVALVGTGAGGSVHVLAAVLLYRIISYWGTLPFGLLGYLSVRRARRAGSTSLDEHDGDRAPAVGDRATGEDRPLVVFGG